MQRPSITVLGECVADAFINAQATAAQRGSEEIALRVLPGGGPANTAVALARLGTPTRFLGRISEDAFGALFRARLGASGVDVAGCVPASQPSTMAIAGLDAEGRASYTFYAEGTADWQWTTAELDALLRSASACVHTGSLALIREPGGERIEEYLSRARPSATICIDPNVRHLIVPPAAYRKRLPHWCALADILRLSEEDLAHLAPGEHPREALARWHGAGARLIVLTRGERGAIASLGTAHVIEVPGIPVEVADTVGAGDAFTAGLLHQLAATGHLGGRLGSLQPGDLELACAYAARVAAATCTTPGAQPPWAHELAADGAPHPGHPALSPDAKPTSPER
jgi:fructokinase